MSYVLDALRKSAPEAPARSSRMLDPATIERGPGAGLGRPIAAGAALSVAAALIFALSGPAELRLVAQPVAQPLAQPVASPPPPGAGHAPDGAPLALSLSMGTNKPVKASADRERLASAAHDKTVFHGAEGLPAPIAAVGAPPAGHADMPGVLREQPPKLTVSGYILDQQAGSLAIIDDRVLRVGEEAAPGVRIEKIDTDGVTFSYRGYRFRR